MDPIEFLWQTLQQALQAGLIALTVELGRRSKKRWDDRRNDTSDDA